MYNDEKKNENRSIFSEIMAKLFVVYFFDSQQKSDKQKKSYYMRKYY